ncbi:hypothetical protein KY290_027033 [Solanum tuberosum]|uniref:Retrotransposon gag domain-containing protein n=1 Tax=Solanum tuberosum TaxID=4113 RepID=A0ABQ7UFK0_SOLTU|nr:hypothetical protein KY284_025991 [Solanum tuberosum]KAH0747801.1 hypothetical protein KY290_027033 [Solanum tuberosum]
MTPYSPFITQHRQTGSIQEYRQEFAKPSSRVTDWPDHCLLGVFMNGLKEELKSDVRIHKPRTVYKAMNLAMEFEQKVVLIVGINLNGQICHDPTQSKLVLHVMFLTNQ